MKLQFRAPVGVFRLVLFTMTTATLPARADDSGEFALHDVEGDWEMVIHYDTFFDEPVAWLALPRRYETPLFGFGCFWRTGCGYEAVIPRHEAMKSKDARVLVRVDDDPVFEVDGETFLSRMNPEALEKLWPLLDERKSKVRIRMYESARDRDMNINSVTLTQSLDGFAEAYSWVFESFIDALRERRDEKDAPEAGE